MPSDDMVSVPRDVLSRAQRALHDSYIAAVTVQPTLSEPYKDDPRWTPWTRWVEGPARKAHDSHIELRKLLGGAGLRGGDV